MPEYQVYLDNLTFDDMVKMSEGPSYSEIVEILNKVVEGGIWHLEVTEFQSLIDAFNTAVSELVQMMDSSSVLSEFEDLAEEFFNGE